jgi:hypothetical protein
MNSMAYLIALFVVLFHFYSTKFALLDQDWKYIVLVLAVWTGMNLLFKSNGLVFRDIKSDALIIKVFLASFFILATTCFYYILCILSQWIKGIKEKHEKEALLGNHRDIEA